MKKIHQRGIKALIEGLDKKILEKNKRIHDLGFAMEQISKAYHTLGPQVDILEGIGKILHDLGYTGENV